MKGELSDVFLKKRKIDELPRLKLIEKIKKEDEENNIRNKNFPLVSPDCLNKGNYIILDKLDISNGIWMFKLKKPAEKWMFEEGYALKYKDYAECIAKIELGMTHDNFTKIEKLGVDSFYRKKG